jgi:penicillin-binding protein 1A
MPAAGKTGTPQNWSDAWAVGYTPYYTTAIWFGFDRPGNSLGVNLTGATLAGPVWGDFMREIHQGLRYRDFIRPSTGIVEVTVCAKSGQLKTAACNEGEVTLPFLEGTAPAEYCTMHGGGASFRGATISSTGPGVLGLDEDTLLGSLSMPTLRSDLLPAPPEEVSDTPRSRNTANRNTNTRTNSRTSSNRGSTSRGTSGARGNSTSSRNPPSDTEAIPDNTGGSGTADSADDEFGLDVPSYNPLLY